MKINKKIEIMWFNIIQRDKNIDNFVYKAELSIFCFYK